MSSQPIPKPITENEIHLWFLPRAAAEKEKLCRGGAGLLASDELDRYRSYRHPTRAKQFQLGRILMRRSLAAHLAMNPGELQFSYGLNGKPELQAAIAGGLVFSLSHARSSSVMAIAYAERIGVDMEMLSRASPVLGIARQFFSAEEMRHIESHSETAAEEALTLWCLKESIVKASGSTIWEGLAKVKQASHGEHIKWLSAPLIGAEPTWCLMHGRHYGDYLLALAMQRNDVLSQPQKMHIHILGSEANSDACFRITGASGSIGSG